MHSFNLFADYFQFYLQDEAIDSDLSDSWTDDAVARLLAVAPRTVGVGTVRNMEVPVTLEVLASEPPRNLIAHDHIVECSLSVAGKNLVIAGCSDYFPEAARIPNEPGNLTERTSTGCDSFLLCDLDEHNAADLEWVANGMHLTLVEIAAPHAGGTMMVRLTKALEAA